MYRAPLFFPLGLSTLCEALRLAPHDHYMYTFRLQTLTVQTTPTFYQKDGFKMGSVGVAANLRRALMLLLSSVNLDPTEFNSEISLVHLTKLQLYGVFNRSYDFRARSDCSEKGEATTSYKQWLLLNRFVWMPL